MNPVSRILKNTTMLIASNVFVKVLGAFLIIMLGRYLSAEGFGDYSFAFSFVAMFIIVSDFGLDALVIRQVARSREQAGQYLETAGILRIGLSALMVVIALAAAFILSLDIQTVVIILFAGLTNMFDRISGLFYAFFRAFERMEFEAITQMIWRGAQVSVGLVAMYLGYSLLEIIMLFLVISIVRCIIGFSWVLAIGIRPSRDGQSTKEIVRLALPFAAYEIGYALYSNILIVLIFLITMESGEVGWFSASYRILIFLLIIPTAFETAIYPVFSKLFKDKPQKMKIAYVKSMKFSLVAAIPSAFILALLSEPIASLFGSDFENSAEMLRIIGFALPFLTLNMILKTVLWSSDIPKIAAWNIFIGTIILGIAAGYLLFSFGYIGAAYGFLIGEIVLFILNFSYVSRKLHRVGRYLWKPVIGGFAMSGVIYAVYIFAESNIENFQMLSIALVVYTLTIVGLKTFTPQDRNIILSALGRYPRRPR